MELFRKLLVCSTMLTCLLPLTWAQTRTVTVSVLRTVSLNPDQASYSLSLQGTLDLTLDQAVSALQPVGVTAQNLTSIITGADTTYSPSCAPIVGPPRLQYNFLLTGNADQLSGTLTSLASLTDTISKQNSSLRFGFQLNGLQPADARVDDARQKAIADLLADARRRATLLAAAAGASLAGIRSIQDSSYGYSTTSYASFLLSNSFLSSSTNAGTISGFGAGTNVSAQPVTFTLSVTFDLQ